VPSADLERQERGTGHAAIHVLLPRSVLFVVSTVVAAVLVVVAVC
jgi:hypothetical protein